MSQWKQIQQLDIKFLEQVDYFYDDNFPMELRQVLANWIESQDWYVVVFLHTDQKLYFQCLLNHILNFWLQENTKQPVKYKANPLHMAAVICNCLREERRILSTASMQEQVLPRHVTNSMQKPHIPHEILSKIADVIKEIDTLISSQLNPELKEWKRRQQIACIGGPVLIGLDQLQNWFTLTAQSLFQIKRQLDKLGELILKVTYESDPIPLQRPQMEEQVKYLIYHLIKSSFVVEKEPCMPTHPQKPLIIKTQVQFTTKVRYEPQLPPNSSCKQGPLSVTEELHSLNFEAMLMLQGLDIDLETCSLPLVVISNVSQLPGGWASVMWYNLLTDDPKNLGFFSNPLRASWSQLSEVLSWQFSSFAGRGLNKEQLNMLGNKLLGQHASYNDCQVSWSKFWKENIPGKSFSFWLWLDSILDLIKKHLLPVWIDGYIMGFVSKEMERALLKEKEPGTFLLRFSESHLGGITFTWVEQDENGDPKFISVEPYTKNRLNALPIADIIRDYKVIADGVVPENPLKFLYPDIPKDEAFGKHYNSQQNKVCPYIQTQLVPISHRK
uniref:Signal transducer and activator of transcription 4-like n=1 Tax=Sinocyclocheilus rhinocerous TaxID=307959 RepID=A0A673G8L0_9TELE